MGASMKDVAKRANVSTATVSHVINGTRATTRETRDKVLRAIEELNYNVNSVARNLRSGSSKIIGYVASNLANYFFMDIAMVLDRILSRLGYHLIYINSNEDPEKERENIQSLLMQNADGLIIAPVREECAYMKALIGEKCPAVFFDRQPTGYNRDSIMVTNREGAFAGTEHLIECGYRKIGFVCSRLDGTMAERIAGYREALLKHGLPADEELVRTGSGVPASMSDEKRGESYENARYLIEERGVDAIFAGNAMAVLGSYSFINDREIPMPGEMGLISFDDPFWLTMSRPKISAVYQDKEMIGKQVAETLLRRINGNTKPYRQTRIPTKMVIRQSGRDSDT
jgi:LacI family transcriptional regulator